MTYIPLKHDTNYTIVYPVRPNFLWEKIFKRDTMMFTKMKLALTFYDQCHPFWSISKTYCKWKSPKIEWEKRKAFSALLNTKQNTHAIGAIDQLHMSPPSIATQVHMSPFVQLYSHINGDDDSLSNESSNRKMTVNVFLMME